MPNILDIYCSIQVKSTTDISLIKDPANSVLVQRVEPLSTTILIHSKGPLVLIHFEGQSILAEPIESSSIDIDIEMGKQRAEPNFDIGWGHAYIYVIPNFYFYIFWVSTLPTRLTVDGLASTA